MKTILLRFFCYVCVTAENIAIHSPLLALASAILLLTSALSSRADETVTLHGVDLVSCEVDGTGGNNINNTSFLPMPPSLSDPNGNHNAEIFVWNCSGFSVYYYFTGPDADNYFGFSGSPDGWYDASGTPANVIWNPGRGMILEVPIGAPIAVTLFGTPVATPSVPPTNYCGCDQYSLIGPQNPSSTTYQDITGMAPVDGAQVYRHIPGQSGSPFTPPNYTIYTFHSGVWSPGDPTLPTTNAEAAFYYVPCATNPCITMSCTGDKTVPCGTIWNFDAPTNIVDSCCTNYTVDFTTVTNSFGCPLVVVRTWTISDVCGHTNSCSQTVTVSSAPTINCPPNKTIPCTASVIFNPPIIITNACCGTNIIVSIYGSDVVTNFGTCSYATTRTWQITDCCGDTNFCHQTITVTNKPPIISCIPDKTIPCSSVLIFNPPHVTPFCCSNITITPFGNDVTNNLGLCSYSVTRTWLVTDCCSLTNFCHQTVTVVNTNAPALQCPTNIVLSSCTTIPVYYSATAVANCCTNVTVTFTPPSGSPFGPGTVTTVHCVATDCCSNSTSCDFTVTVNLSTSTNCCCDDCNPPYPICYTNIIYIGFNYLVNHLCQGTNDTLSDVLHGVGDGTELLKWNVASQSYTDIAFYDAGSSTWYDAITFNPSTATLKAGETFVLDNPGPQFDLTICGCDANCPLPCLPPTNGMVLVGRFDVGTAAWTNLSSCPPQCGTEVMIWNPVTQSFSTDEYLNGGWTPQDPVLGVGQSAFVRLIPCTNCIDMTCVGDKTVPCGTFWSFDAPSNIVDNCCSNYSVTISTITNSFNCSLTATRTWWVVDTCGNSNSCSQTVTVSNVPPLILCSPNKTIPCTSALVFDPPSVTNGCCTNISIGIFGADVVTNLGPCAHSVTRTWLIVDCCYSNFCQQTITVTNVPPVINCSPAKTISCASSLVFDPPTVTNTCCTNILISHFGSDVTNHLGLCSYTVTRTWLVTDCCGFSNFCQQVVTIVDTNAPALQCPTNIVVSSCSTIPVFYSATAVDDCCTNVTVTFTPPSGSPFGPGTVTTVHCVATDCCSNSTSCDFTVTVNPSTSTNCCCDNCNPPYPICYTNTVYVGFNFLANLLCHGTNNTLDDILHSVPDGTELLEWNTNTESYDQIAIYDSGSGGWLDANTFNPSSATLLPGEPFILDNPGPQFVLTNCGCEADCPLPCLTPTNGFVLVGDFYLGNATWTNLSSCPPECGTEVMIWNPVTQSFSTDEYLNGSWTPQDPVLGLGQSAFVRVIPCTNCIDMTCVGDKTVPCGTFWSFDAPSNIVDNCCSNFSLTFTTTTNSFNCPLVVTRTWWVVDTCGNSNSCSQTVTVSSTPVINCSPNKTIPCTSGLVFNPPTVTNACCTNILISIYGSDVVTNVGPCAQATTRTWLITDCCGNSNFCQQTITVTNTAPTVNCSPNKTIPCTSALVFDPPTVTNACCTNISISIFGSDVTNNFGSCSHTVTRTWLITDCCYSNFCQQTITVSNVPPVILCNPNKTIPCTSGLVFNPPTVTNTCCTNIFISIFGSDVTNNFGSCSHTVTRTWLITDCCYSNFCQQTITVTNTAPTINCSTNKTIPCTATLVFDPPTVTNGCCTNIVISIFGNDVTNHLGTCAYTVTRSWLIMDCCSTNACSQTITVTNSAPIIRCSPNKTIPCTSALVFDPPSVTNTCCTNISISIFGSDVVTNLGPCAHATTRTWLITDCCGDTNFCEQTITVTNTGPTITCNPDKTIPCTTNLVFNPPGLTNGCCTNVFVSIFGVDVTNLLGPCSYSVTRNWRIVDCCSTNFCQQKITVTNTPMVVICPTDKIIPCNSNVFFDLPQVAVSCRTNAITVISNLTTIIGPCTNVFTRYWRITDGCATNICHQSVTVTHPPPLLSGTIARTNPCGTALNWTTPLAVDPCCSTNLTVKVLRTVTNSFNPLIVARTWTATNCCGLTNSFTETITMSQNPPPNDDCSGAIPLIAGIDQCGSTLCATPSAAGTLAPAPCGTSINSPDVWYSYTSGCGGTVTFDTCQTNCDGTPNFNTVLSVYSGICGSLTQVPGPSCNDDACNAQSRVTLNNLTPCTTYYIRVAGHNNAIGNFRLRATETVTPPPNDHCANATVVVNGTYSFRNCGADTDGPNTGTNCPSFNDVWFRYTANCSGQVWVETCNSCISTVLSVYTGSCSNLSLVACNAQATLGRCAGGNSSFVQFNAVNGQTYLIRVGSAVLNDTGSGFLTVNGPYPAVGTCPPAGPCTWRYFTVVGNGNNIPWSWSIQAPCCANIQVTNVPGVLGTASQLATAFVASINGLNCPGLHAQTAFSGGFPGRFRVCCSCNNWVFRVGGVGTPEQNQCVVPYNSQLGPLGPCVFNPQMYELELSGHDYNSNDVDDAIDILDGTSLDLDQDGIPDEVESCVMPVFTDYPESQVVTPGTNITLSASAAGTGPLTYQWYLNGSPVVDNTNVIGGSSNILTILSVETENLGEYSVVASNACGIGTSAPADLSVYTVVSPIIAGQDSGNGSFQFSFPTQLGVSYVVEYTEDLTSPDWTPLETVEGDGDARSAVDPSPDAPKRFYRVRSIDPP